MKTTCTYCKQICEFISHGIIEAGDYITLCHDCYLYGKPQETFVIGLDSTGKRLSHWKEIKTRIRTHEGELLSGNKGIEYQSKWSSKYLGRDLSSTRPLSRDVVEKYNSTHT